MEPPPHVPVRHDRRRGPFCRHGRRLCPCRGRWPRPYRPTTYRACPLSVLLSAPLNRRSAQSASTWRVRSLGFDTKFDRPSASWWVDNVNFYNCKSYGGGEHFYVFKAKSLIYLALAVSLALALSEWSPTPPPPAPHTSKPPGSPAPTSSRPSRVTRTRTTASVRRPRHVKPTCRPRDRTSSATAGTTPAALAAARHHHPLKPHRRRQH